jgi:hypothetical protein
MRTACFTGNRVFVAGKSHVATRNPIISADRREYKLLDTQEVTDSSSVEPTTSFNGRAPAALWECSHRRFDPNCLRVGPCCRSAAAEASQAVGLDVA